MNTVYKLGRLTLQFKPNKVSSYFIFLQNRSVALYSPDSLGVDRYSQSREQFMGRMSHLTDNFRSKMFDFTKDGSNNMIFTEDLKTMLHLCTKTDVELLNKMLKKFCAQNKELRFGNYVFGPVIMRTLYFLDLPKEAFQAFKDPELTGLFDQLMSYHILMDLLYKHNMYSEVLEIFDYVSSKQTHMLKFPKHVLVLAMGALYKQNTEESLNKAKLIWAQARDAGHIPMRRAATFLAGLALNQGSPHIALEVLSTISNQNYFTVRNMKVYALSELNRPDDAFPLIRSGLEFDGPRENQSLFIQETIEHLQAAVDRLNNNDMKREYNQLLKALVDRSMIDKENSIEDLLCKEIKITQYPMKSDQTELQESFSNRRSSFQGRPNYNRQPGRPGLADRFKL